jgi:hypothetical protein
LILGEFISAAISFPLAVQPFHGGYPLRGDVGHDQLISRLQGSHWGVVGVRPMPCPVEHSPDIHDEMGWIHRLDKEDFMLL